jgi:hypothetical protein
MKALVERLQKLAGDSVTVTEEDDAQLLDYFVYLEALDRKYGHPMKQPGQPPSGNAPNPISELNDTEVV